MSDPLDDRLAGLRSAPVPPLAPAAQVRARAAQRRRRAQAAAATAVAAVVVLGGAGVVAATDRADDAVRFVEPGPTATGSPEESGWPLLPAFVDPEDADRARPASWEAVEPFDQATMPLLDPCREQQFPGAADVVAQDEQRLVAADVGAVVTQQVFRYSSGPAAERAFGEYAAQVERCAARPGSTAPYQLFASDYGHLVKMGCDPSACTSVGTTHALVARERDGLTVVTYGSAADDDPLEVADALLTIAYLELNAAVRGEPSSGPPSQEDADVAALFLPTEQAARAEPEGWRVSGEPAEPGPLLDPCDERAFPRADDVVASGERVLSWQRDATGADLRQEVFRYRSAESAERAFAEYAGRVRRCASPPIPDDPNGGSLQFDAVEQTSAGGGAQLLVRLTPCVPGCTAHFRTYVGVAQHGDAVTVLSYGQYADSDPLAEARALLAVAAEHLAGAQGDR